MTTRILASFHVWRLCAALAVIATAQIFAADQAPNATPQSILNLAPPRYAPTPQPAANLVDAAPVAPQLRLTLKAPSSTIHILPPPTSSAFRALAAAAATPTPLVYHAEAPIMPNATIYTIFWVPKTLQNGSTTGMTPAYSGLQNRHLTDYPAHAIHNNNTQYYQVIKGATTYVQNIGRFGGTFTDHAAYPASDCKDSATPGGCITDAQIQAEIKKVVTSQKWSGGFSNIFFLFTSSGEGSCFDASSASCAYTQYCAYHGAIPGSLPIIYANMPYGDPAACQTSGTPSPSGDAAADTAITAASHELTEAITDPLLNAWFTAGGLEIGDLCAYKYGSNSWDSGKANQMWNGNFYEVQQEYDNHTNTCVQVGP
jgi:hypothetical protein